MTVYTESHRCFLEKLGVSLEELKSLSEKEEEIFISEVLIPYICGAGTQEEEEIADDIIDLMKGEYKNGRRK